MTVTARLHVIGSSHEARYGESFDAALDTALHGAQDPIRAAGELDELGLLTVLACFAAAGDHRPVAAAPVTAWGLEVDRSDRRVRRHRFGVQYSFEQVDEFVFIGVSLSSSQTVVTSVSVDPGVYPAVAGRVVAG